MALAAPALRRGGRGFAFLWGAVAIALLVLAAFAPQIGRLALACPFKAVTGLPCPTCGTLRAALALARLDPLAALRANPLAAISWIVVVAGGILAALFALAGRPVAEPPSRLSWPARAVIIGVLLANWAFLVVRGV